MIKIRVIDNRARRADLTGKGDFPETVISSSLSIKKYDELTNSNNTQTQLQLQALFLVSYSIMT